MYFFRYLIFFLFFFPAYAGTGNVDDREYVDWSTSPYNKIVLLYNSGTCTAQYVWHDIILTARHCVVEETEFDDYKNLGKKYTIYLHTGEKTEVTLESYGKNVDYGDWALLRVTDPKFYSKDFFIVPKKQQYIEVTNAGFGYMRILKDEEIKKLSAIFKKIQKQNNIKEFDKTMEKATQEIEAEGIESLLDYNLDFFELTKYEVLTYNLKAHKGCRLLKGNKRKWTDKLMTTCDAFAGNSGGPYFSENTLFGICSSGNDSFENIYNTDSAVQVTKYYKNLEKMKKQSPNIKNSLETTATFEKEDAILSTPYTQLEKQNIVPIKNEAITIDKSTTDISESEILNNIQNLINTPEVKEVVFDNENVNDESVDDTEIEEIGTQKTEIITQNQLPNIDNVENIDEKQTNTTDSEKIELQIQKVEATLQNQLPEIETMNDETFLNFLDKFTEYLALKEILLRAEQREQSIENRLLGAAAIGFSGIGGMQLASGLAEQKADKAAEQDMQAYIATMYCKYGNSESTKYGNTNVELPGGNKLYPLVTEYKQLAADLKQRKETLGLPMGIESQAILEKANISLYDNTSIEKVPGAYASVYKALTDTDSNDATSWEEQKNTAQDKIDIGTTVGGIGVIGGTIGNMIENSLYDKK